MKHLIFLAAVLFAAFAHADVKLQAGQTISFSQGYPEYKPGAAAEQATQITVCKSGECQSYAIGKPVPRLVQFQLDVAADLINAHLASGKSLTVTTVDKVLVTAAEMKTHLPVNVRKYVEALEKRTTMALVRADAYASKFGPLDSPVSQREPSSR